MVTYNFVICAVFKNESHILSEWIQHYLLRGVEHIYLVNDFSTDDYSQILEGFSDVVTVFHNDIVTKEVGRQSQIYEKYFRPLLTTTKWMAILDLDEFLYSPSGAMHFGTILDTYDSVSQLKIDWLHFGSNGHTYQPTSVVSGFIKRDVFNNTAIYYSHKTIFKTDELIAFGIHSHQVRGTTSHLEYNEINKPILVINHYNLQSYDFYINVKCTRGDCDNWFESQRLERNDSLFRQLDKNDVIDLTLFEQNKDRVSFNKSIKHTDDVTLVITSCNREALLDKTLESFVKMNTYPVALTYIIDDSGVVGCNDYVVEKYKDVLNIRSIYNPVNLGQVQSIDKVYSYVRTKWIFHCEEDWQFLQPGFIEKSMHVFAENPDEKIYTVWLRPHWCTSGHPIVRDNLNRGYYAMKKDFSYVDKGVTYTWGGITFNPGLRKTTDCLLVHPYSLRCEKSSHNGKTYVGEYTINKEYVQRGYYAMILADPEGHVNHIGWNAHIKREWD